MYLRLFVVPNRFLSVCLPTFFLNSKKHVRRCGDKPIYIGAVLEDGRKGRNYMDENKEISTISVAVELEGLDQVNEELDKMLIKLEKANSLADELASKLKNELDIDCSKVANLVSETIHGKASITR